MTTLLRPLLLACALLAPAVASAAGCSISSSGLAFGRYQPLTFEDRLVSVPATSDATVTVSCIGIVTGGTYTISLGPSMAGGGDRINTRYMSNAAGGPDLMFNVYRDPGYSSVWGDGVTAGATIGGTLATGDSYLTHTVYGRIPAGQSTVRAGVFSATMTMTMSYNP